MPLKAIGLNVEERLWRLRSCFPKAKKDLLLDHQIHDRKDAVDPDKCGIGRLARMSMSR